MLRLLYFSLTPLMQKASPKSPNALLRLTKWFWQKHAGRCVTFCSDALLLGLDAAIFKRQGMRALRRWSANKQAYDIEIGLSIRTDEFFAQYEFVLGRASDRRDDYYVKREACLIEKEGQKSEFQSENGRWVSNSRSQATGRYPDSQEDDFEPHY